MNTSDSRYPYTYACDYLRAYGGADKGGVKMSRSEASAVREAVAKAIGMTDEELAKKLADYYNEHEEEISDYSSNILMRAIGV